MTLLTTQGEIITDKYIAGFLVREYNARIPSEAKIEKIEGVIQVSGKEFDLSKCFNPMKEIAAKSYKARREPLLLKNRR
jgi:hypothetical protein